jgi:acyl carrier protein
MVGVAEEVMAIVAPKVRTAHHTIGMTDSLDSLGLESLDVLEILLDLEQRFDIEIPYNANTKLEFATVGEMVQAMERLIAERAASK